MKIYYISFETDLGTQLEMFSTFFEAHERKVELEKQEAEGEFHSYIADIMMEELPRVSKKAIVAFFNRIQK